MSLGLVALSALSACGSDAVQTEGCEDVPRYEHRARFGEGDGGITPAMQAAIREAVANGCITDVGSAMSLPDDEDSTNKE